VCVNFALRRGFDAVQPPSSPFLKIVVSQFESRSRHVKTARERGSCFWSGSRRQDLGGIGNGRRHCRFASAAGTANAAVRRRFRTILEPGTPRFALVVLQHIASFA
jgi:hypothetical protein